MACTIVPQHPETALLQTTTRRSCTRPVGTTFLGSPHLLAPLPDPETSTVSIFDTAHTAGQTAGITHVSKNTRDVAHRENTHQMDGLAATGFKQLMI